MWEHQQRSLARRIFEHISKTPLRINMQKNSSEANKTHRRAALAPAAGSDFGLIVLCFFCCFVCFFWNAPSWRRSQHTCLIRFLLSVIAAPAQRERARRLNDLQRDWTRSNKTRCESPVRLKSAFLSDRRGLCEAWKQSRWTEGTRWHRARARTSGWKKSGRGFNKWREMFFLSWRSSTFSSPLLLPQYVTLFNKCGVSKGSKATKKCNNDDNCIWPKSSWLECAKSPFRQKKKSKEDENFNFWKVIPKLWD